MGKFPFGLVFSRAMRTLCGCGLIALCLGTAAGACRTLTPIRNGRAQAQAQDTEFPGKLPDGAEPRLYDVHLVLDPNASRFTGVVDLAVELLEPDDRVVLHADGLNLHSVGVRAGDGRPRQIQTVAHQETGTLQLHFSPPLPSGVSTLHFAYDAPYGEALDGIYRVVNDGRAYLFSQFEPIAARKAFPCFDEPRFKAPFQLTLSVPNDAFAASNGMVVAEQERMPGFKTLVFRPTPPLPSYLVAVAVGPFDVAEGELSVSPQRPYALPLRGLATRGNGSKLKMALNRTNALVQALESYVDLPYPFAKLDVAAVPDFAWGAMENAGLITFRDWLLLLHGAHPPYGQRRAFESVMAHELTHQWFGNWVTMPWWDDLWLNEAFASWRGQRTAAHTRPGMQFAVEQVEATGNAMDEDGLRSVRRVREPCRDKNDVHNAADTITYLKGAGILTMFEHFVGPERFMQGVRAYLRRFPFATADSTTFLTTVAEVSQEPALSEAMQTFLDQPGVPEVRFSWRCEDGQATLLLAQERWLPLGSEAAAGLWKVPVCVRYGTANGGKQHLCTVLREPSHTLALRGCPTWFVANADGAGYYRSRVEDERAEQAALLQRRMNAAETFSALDNTAAMLRSGALDGDSALGRMASLLSHDNPRVVRRAAEYIDGLRRRHVPSAEQAPAQARLRALLLPQVRRLMAEQARLAAQLTHKPPHGGEAEALSDALGEVLLALKELQRQLALSAQDAQTRGLLAHQGAMWLDAYEAGTDAADRDAKLKAVQARVGLDDDSLDLALAVAGEALGAPLFERLLAVLEREPGGEVRRRVVQALGLLGTEGEAKRARALLLDPRLHVNEMLAVLLPQLALGPNQAEAWRFVAANLDPLLARLSAKDRARLIVSGGAQCTPAAAHALQAQFGPRLAHIAGGMRVLNQAHEAVLQCVAELQVQSPSVRAFFGHSEGR